MRHILEFPRSKHAMLQVMKPTWQHVLRLIFANRTPTGFTRRYFFHTMKNNLQLLFANFCLYLTFALLIFPLFGHIQAVVEIK